MLRTINENYGIEENRHRSEMLNIRTWENEMSDKSVLGETVHMEKGQDGEDMRKLQAEEETDWDDGLQKMN